MAAPEPAITCKPARLCPACGYDLRALASDRCPECGLAMDRGASAESSIPWAHRHVMGKRRAYARTVRLAMLHPRRLAAEVARPTRYEDARAFSARTARRAWYPLALLVLWAYAATLRLPVVPDVMSSRDTLRWRGGISRLPGQVRAYTSLEPGDPLSGWFALELLCIVTLLLALWLMLSGMLRAASVFFHPRDLPVAQQNRAVAIAQYGGAALAWLPWLTPLLAFALWDQVLSHRWMSNSPGVPGRRHLLAAAAALPALLLGWSWVTWMILLKRTLHCGAGRVIALAVTLPVLWLFIMSAALSMPAMLFVLCVLWASL